MDYFLSKYDWEIYKEKGYDLEEYEIKSMSNFIWSKSNDPNEM